MDARLSGTLNANVADLSDFARRGGKLLLYTGIADPAVPVAEVVNYYDRVVAAAGGPSQAAQFARLFLVPGMGHCFGGPGVTNIGQLGEAMPTSPKNDILMQLVADRRWRDARPDRRPQAGGSDLSSAGTADLYLSCIARLSQR